MEPTHTIYSTQKELFVMAIQTKMVVDPSYKIYPHSVAIVSVPVALSTLISASQNFTWNDVHADEYELWIGSALGLDDLGNYVTGGLTVAAINLPVDGSTLYVRLHSKFGIDLLFNDYTYTTFS